jgi:hypothetical protein
VVAVMVVLVVLVVVMVVLVVVMVVLVAVMVVLVVIVVVVVLVVAVVAVVVVVIVVGKIAVGLRPRPPGIIATRTSLSAHRKTINKGTSTQVSVKEMKVRPPKAPD